MYSSIRASVQEFPATIYPLIRHKIIQRLSRKYSFYQGAPIEDLIEDKKGSDIIFTDRR